MNTEYYVKRESSRAFTLIESRSRGTNSRFTLIELLAVPGSLSRRSHTKAEARRATRLMRFTLIELLVVIAIIA
ncbi:MAG: prepilin-type N-terminal cleavage/methylation domain-containing protein, partial [Victivallales bacterium]|nr:prepilin-type N-terminal cleavage/methylation domain-containing protein [Victivallales bacterium]